MKTPNGPQKSNGGPESEFFERAVRLENEIDELTEDRKVLWADVRRQLGAKDEKALKGAVKRYRMDAEKFRREVEERKAVTDMLARVLGEFIEEPLGRAAVARHLGTDPDTGEIRD